MKGIITTLILATSIFAASNMPKDIYAQKGLGNYTQTISQKRDITEIYKNGKITQRVLVSVVTKPNGTTSTSRRLIKYDKSGKETYNSILSPVAFFALTKAIEDNGGKF